MIALTVTDDRTRLWVATTFEPAKFGNIKALEKKLALKPLPKPEPGAGRSTSLWEQIWRLEGLPGRAVLGIGAMLAAAGGFFADRLVPDVEVAMVSPQDELEPSHVAAGCVGAIWRVKRDRLLDDGVERIDGTANVHLIKADSTMNVVISNHQSGKPIHLPPGVWDLFVFDEELERQSDVVRVVAEKRDYDAQRDAFVGKCGEFSG